MSGLTLRQKITIARIADVTKKFERLRAYNVKALYQSPV